MAGIVHTSFHNGTAYRREHNARIRAVTDKEEHIDRHGKYEIWHDEKLTDAYERIFGEAIREYNEKQKRKDRRIDPNYLKTIQEDKDKHPVYEVIVGVYAQEETVIQEKEAREILREFYDTWKERNPNLEIVGAYYHADEQGSEPHIHIDYVPVAEYAKHGAKLQNGLVKALEQQGIELQKSNKENGIPWKTAQTQWQDREREVFDELCRARGYTVEHPVIEERKEAQEHLETKLYKLKAQMEELEYQVAQTIEGRESTEREVTEVQNKLTKAKEELSEITGEVRRQKLAKKKDPKVKHKFIGEDQVQISWYDWKAMEKTWKDVKTVDETKKKIQEELEKQKEVTKELRRREQASRDIEQRERDLERAMQKQESIVKAKVEQKVEELFQGNQTSYERRLEDFIKGYSIKEKNMLDIFKESERALKQSMSRGIGR